MLSDGDAGSAGKNLSRLDNRFVTYYSEGMHHFGSRVCARCSKELTDAASMDVGIGPICRKLDNAILARTIPANISEAMRLAATISEDSIPEPARPTLQNVLADLVDFTNKDWRSTVKRVEWLLSWGMSASANKTLIAVVRALGYIGLAAVLTGEASTGAAHVMTMDGRLHIFGSRNKAGQHAIKKVKGWRWHNPTSALKGSWSLPVAAADEFASIVMTYWPNVEKLEEVIEMAKEQVQVAPAPVGPVVTLTLAGEWLKVRTPFNQNFVNALKTLNYKSRKWNSVEKVWEVSVVCKGDVEQMIAAHYPTATTQYVSPSA